ncbi:putative harbinger transposase-derived protein [Tanacetum coccineum]
MYEQKELICKPNKISALGMIQMKGVLNDLMKTASKWVAAYKAAYSRMKSGMSMKDVELDAHKIYEGDELRAMRITRESEIEVMNKRLEVDKKREEREIKREERELKREERELKKRKEREQGETRLMADYFVDNPTFDEVIFRRRFRMRKHLFIRIVDSVTANDRYFQQRRDATGRQSLSSLAKCTGLAGVAYGVSFDAVDEYLRMSGAVTRKSLMSFVQGVISCFGDEYLRRPNEDDLARISIIEEQRWAGQYAGRSGKPTIILEAVASYDLWIWHAFFGTKVVQ